MTQGKKKISQKESKGCKNNLKWNDMKFAHSRAGQWICSGCAGTRHINTQRFGFCYQRTQRWHRTSALAPRYHSQHRHLRYRCASCKMHCSLDNGVKGWEQRGASWPGNSISKCWGTSPSKFMRGVLQQGEEEAVSQKASSCFNAEPCQTGALGSLLALPGYAAVINTIVMLLSLESYLVHWFLELLLTADTRDWH